jgi:hypothetical protein
LRLFSIFSPKDAREIKEALQKPGFFKEFLGGQVCVAASLSKDIRARKQTCLTTKLLKKTVF